MRALTCPPGKRDFVVFDALIPGFGIRVTAGGVKTFFLQFQLGGRSGRKERFLIGRHLETRIVDGEPQVATAAWARSEAERARGMVRSGISPTSSSGRQIPSRRHYSFGRLIDDWATSGLEHASPRYRAEAPPTVRRFFADLLPLPAAGILRAQVRDLVQSGERRAPVGVRTALRRARAAFNWALSERDLKAPGNPFEKVLRGAGASRQRVLSDAEIGEAWRAAAALPPPFGVFLQMLMLTLQRRNELAGIRWEELSPDFALWSLPGARAKNREAHIVHMAEPARAILRAIPRGLGSPFIFPATRARPTRRTAGGNADAARPISGFSDVADRLRALIRAERARAPGVPLAAVPVPDWRLHDFRRTGVTVMARLGVPEGVADRVLNHVEGRKAATIAEVYQRHQFLPEREAAMDLWAQHILRVAKTGNQPDGAE